MHSFLGNYDDALVSFERALSVHRKIYEGNPYRDDEDDAYLDYEGDAHHNAALEMIKLLRKLVYLNGRRGNYNDTRANMNESLEICATYNVGAYRNIYNVISGISLHAIFFELRHVCDIYGKLGMRHEG